MPRPVVFSALAVEFAAAAVTVAAVWFSSVNRVDLLRFGALVVAASVYIEFSRRIERTRFRHAETPHVNMNGVWSFAAALVLPPVLAVALVVLIHGHMWARVWRSARPGLGYRHVFNTAVVILAVQAASTLMMVLGAEGRAQIVSSGPGGLAVIVVVLAAYFLVNLLLVGFVIALTRPSLPLRGVLGRWSDNLLEIATLCLGALTALGLTYRPWLVVLVMPSVFALHGNVLIRQLEEAARTDAKTGLLNALYWHDLAGREIARTARVGTSLGLLLVDLDHFKRVNDTHGHLAGDEVLRTLAPTLQNEVREYDLVGRFGGEEFAILLPGLAEPEVAQVAERIRARVAEMSVSVPGEHGPTLLTRLTVSIGAATYPRAGTSLDELMLAADTALYAAKAAGRNQVRLSTDPSEGHGAAHTEPA